MSGRASESCLECRWTRASGWLVGLNAGLDVGVDVGVDVRLDVGLDVGLVSDSVLVGCTCRRLWGRYCKGRGLRRRCQIWAECCSIAGWSG